MKRNDLKTAWATLVRCLDLSRTMRVFLPSLVIAPLALGCAAGIPAPTQRLADAQSAERSARELGAEEQPDAQLSLKLAQDQIAMAEKAMEDGENERADSLLIRARADAELALAQARETHAEVGVTEASEDSAQQKTINEGQGAVR